MSLLRQGEPVLEKGLSPVQRDEGPGASAYLSKVLFGPWQKEFTTEAGREVARLIRAGPGDKFQSRHLTYSAWSTQSAGFLKYPAYL